MNLKHIARMTASLVIGSSTLLSAAEPAAKPNIIFVVADDMGFFDNGGVSPTSGIETKGKIGGRTIGLLEWPAKIPQARQTDMPVCHVDMYPTVLDITGVTMDHQPVLDGVSILPLIEGAMESRPQPLGFASGRYAGKEDPPSCEFVTGVWLDGRHMLRLNPVNRKRMEESMALYDIIADPAQETDLADQHPDKVQAMRKDLGKWMASVMESFEGDDYGK